MRSSGSSALTVARVPTGMNAGVSTLPCGVEKTPARAAPAEPAISNEKSIVINPNKTAQSDGPRRSASDNRHCITIRIQSVPFGDCFLIRPHGEIVPGEGRDEHDERRTRKVKVGDQTIDGAKLVRWPNEDSGIRGLLAEDSIVTDSALQGADAGGADRPDFAAFCTRFVQDPRRARGQRVRLLVHHVVGGALGLNRFEGAGSNM